jgi:CheY-like chemotaxis protein
MKKKSTILVIEDDENDRYLVERTFAKARTLAHLQFATDGEEAIDYLAGNGRFHDRQRFPIPTLVLLDIKMPKVMGFDVLRWLKTKDGLKRLPVIVLSSSDLQPDIDLAYELGANAYLVKPFSLGQLEKVYTKAAEFFTVDAASPAM